VTHKVLGDQSRLAVRAGYFCSQDKEVKMLTVFYKWVTEKLSSEQERAREAYLAQSVDQVDLEHRMRTLMRKGWFV